MEDVQHLLEWIGSMLLHDEATDLTLIVAGVEIPVHRNLLAGSCEYFRALLCGGMDESRQSKIVLPGVPLRGFKEILKYIYTTKLNFQDLDEVSLLEILEIAHLYGLEKLESSLSEHLEKALSVENVCMVYETAHSLNLELLSESCRRFMDQQSHALLRDEAFYKLPASAIAQLLSRNTFYVKEIEIFGAVKQWCDMNPTDRELPEVLDSVRLPLIDIVNLATTVKDSGLFAGDRLREARRLKEKHLADLPVRGIMTSGENLATADRGSVELTGLLPVSSPSSTPRIKYEIKAMPPCASKVKVDSSKGLTIALSENFFINYIAFRLSEEAPVPASYYIEASLDLLVWARIIDFSGFACRSLQRLFFNTRIVRYLRIIFSMGADRNDIVLSGLEVARSLEKFTLVHGFYAPRENVASTELGATVIECGGGKDGLIDKMNASKPGISKGTWHRIGGGAIILQLSQPYSINYMRLLLHTLPSRGYSYYIETSVNKREWTRVVDRTAEDCVYWQSLSFPSLPVAFIKIVATSSRSGEYFECSNFECRAMSEGSRRERMPLEPV
ncbi:BTB/POZ domain-containing protein 9 [Galendromus occidentalis]|uniref:BTB/POZ domain-containing protein 9 n=1 Tax=Galendromus occidentalis TaxID=34638 RepID=A0AAJ6QW65_9ACAR|nr:BTB/POZ domain-containing protein 9 [Galendromus occidentalis]